MNRTRLMGSLLGSALAAGLAAPAAPIPRVTPSSRMGRRLAQAKGAQLSDDCRIPIDILDWNAEVDRKRLAKELAKRQSKGT